MLNVSNISKQFDKVRAVDDLSLSVRSGEIFGLLGPNGAGKTTTIRMVLNIITPDAGSILFDGKPFDESVWNRIGYLPEERGLYRKSRVLDVVGYFASLKGISPSEAKKRAFSWMERFEIADRAHDKVEQLSKGNQQKIQFIISVLHRPKFLILDEPFSGLDPVNQLLLKDVLAEIRGDDVAVIFSTHQMEQAERLCDSICLVNNGHPVLNGSLSDIKRGYGSNAAVIEFDGDAAALKALPMVESADVYTNTAEFRLKQEAKSDDLIAALAEKVSLRKFELKEPSLHTIFLSAVGHQSIVEGVPS